MVVVNPKTGGYRRMTYPAAWPQFWEAITAPRVLAS